MSTSLCRVSAWPFQASPSSGADSHTGTIGALGALAWGIGISETEHALATQTLSLRRPKTLRVWIEGAIEGPVAAKDIILALIGQIGANGGAGYMVEFAGPAVDALSIEGRMTLCNMGVEFGAWSAIVAPDPEDLRLCGRTRVRPAGEGLGRRAFKLAGPEVRIPTPGLIARFILR